jgi:transcriptional regulator
MYVPTAFAETRPEVLHEIMRRYGFATLVSHDAAGAITATPLPVLFDVERNGLRSHMARANPQWQGFSPEREVMVLFAGPHGYVSPSWYETKLAVPTWNYVTVHAHGKPRIVEGEAVLQIVADTVRQYESGREEPWDMPLPGEYVTNLLRGVVGFEIDITRLEGKLKLNQNRSKADVDGVIAALTGDADTMNRELAEWMRRVAP